MAIEACQTPFKTFLRVIDYNINVIMWVALNFQINLSSP